MRKVIKYFFIVLLVLIILVVVFIFISVNSINEKTSDGEEYASIVVMQISNYYTTRGQYPNNLNDLEVFNNPDFVFYVDSHSFRYSTYSQNGQKYIISWRAGIMNWTEYLCTNDTSEPSQKDQNIIRTYKMTDDVVCYVNDLH